MRCQNPGCPSLGDPELAAIFADTAETYYKSNQGLALASSSQPAASMSLTTATSQASPDKLTEKQSERESEKESVRAGEAKSEKDFKEKEKVLEDVEEVEKGSVDTTPPRQIPIQPYRPEVPVQVTVTTHTHIYTNIFDELFELIKYI